jgi:hypothetical protein
MAQRGNQMLQPLFKDASNRGMMGRPRQEERERPGARPMGDLPRLPAVGGSLGAIPSPPEHRAAEGPADESRRAGDVAQPRSGETDDGRWPGELLVPQLCGKARGVAGTDYTTKMGQNPGPWDEYAKPNYFDNCWYTMSKFRPLYPEFKNMADKLSEALRGSRHTDPRTEPLDKRGNGGSHRTRHSASSPNSWIIPGVGLLRVRSHTEVNTEPSCDIL